jgi:hypothetical protein
MLGVMFDLWRLKRSRRKTALAYERDLRKLRKNKKATPKEFEDLRQAKNVDLLAEDESINTFLTAQLWEEAREYDVEIPQGEGTWEESGVGTNRYYLTMAARAQVRRLIDEEKARRFEVKTRWITRIILPVIAALIGIIGAITGLVAVLYRK